jgi:hypothetical protein
MAKEWVRRACTLVWAWVAAHASWHQHGYTREGGQFGQGSVVAVAGRCWC